MAFGDVLEDHGRFGHGVVVEGDAVVEAAFERVVLRPAAIRVLRHQEVADALGDAGAVRLALLAGQLGLDAAEEAHLGGGRAVVEGAHESPEAVPGDVEIGGIDHHGLGIVGIVLAAQAWRLRAVLVLAPAAGRGLEADDGIGDGAGLGRAVPGSRFVERHLAAACHRSGWRGLAGLEFGGQGVAVELVLLLRACDVVGPQRALRGRQFGQARDAHVERGGIGADDGAVGRCGERETYGADQGHPSGNHHLVSVIWLWWGLRAPPPE